MIKSNCSDKRVLAAICNIEHVDEFKTVVEWLTGELQAMREENDTAMHTALIHNQGGCQALSAVLKTIRDARETMKAIEARPPVRHGTWV